MDFDHSDKVKGLQARVAEFMQEHVIPAETPIAEWFSANRDEWGAAPMLEPLKDEAKRQGLWNLFLPEDSGGAGLANLEYAPLAEITGWSPTIGPEALNCAAPDTGNMVILSRYGSPELQERWLVPLLAGEIRSCFSMTEPAVASSDANNIALRIDDAGDSWVLNGSKWWSSAALRRENKVALVMGVTDPDAEIGRRHSLVVVPMDTPGLTVLRSTTVFGFDDRHEGGHGVIDYVDVCVPKANLLGERGDGFAVAQSRLGTGRIHHCMRLIGMAERAVAMMTERAKGRVTLGLPVADQGVFQIWLADARIHIEAARLVVLKAAYTLDARGDKEARHEIAAAKILVPQMARDVIDRAIQTFGGAGVSSDFALSYLYATARYLQIADGPDEVHRRSLARSELRREPLLKVSSS
ncbi:MAG: acyl-CoA dehydrogenase [Actinobacteria bacterium]|uniref:Unannotated protein n=1 Tax=freshwater metagenome TaxID=449393 RepID=A0A6J7NXM0_9ZZZZ|nr:acyl-CoA dehydrogenase [Actinomycetota bacterium]